MRPRELLITLVSFYQIAVIAACVLSLVRASPHHPFVRFIRSITEPVFAKVRKAIPPIAGRFDLTPVIVLVALGLIQWMLGG